MRGRCAGRSACRCRSDERCISVTASRGTREARGVRAGGWPVGVRVVMGAGFCLVLSFVSDVCDCIGSYFIELLYERAACVIRVPWKYGLWSLSPATSVISLLGSRDRHKGEALWGWGWARARYRWRLWAVRCAVADATQTQGRSRSLLSLAWEVGHTVSGSRRIGCPQRLVLTTRQQSDYKRHTPNGPE